MNVAVDAMGGDHAPELVVQGAVDAVAELGINIILVGHEKRVAEALNGHPTDSHISFHHCEEVVRMEESPLKALRKKKDASIRVAFDLVKSGRADAVISAGNSGATLAAAVMTLGRMKGVDRPAIAGILPTERGPIVLIDVGANVDCRPSHLFQFGVMANAFASSCLGINNPTVGLLSIGEEEGKGNEQVRLARELFAKSDLNFVGNVEGRDILSGKVKIIVCDGFVGNVVLKLTEGTVAVMGQVIERELMGSFLGRAALMLGRNAIYKFIRRLDYEEHGGAPLLGINGVGMICHGGSSAKAIKNAIHIAVQYVNNRVLEKMTLQLKASKPC
jgi:glycerol-3-phosphate acyltransferase PlsX